MASEAPRLETERLVLRAYRESDLAAMTAMWADPAVTRFIGGRTFTREQTWGKLLTRAGHWPVMGFGYWAAEEKATGRFVGEGGFAEMRREMEPSVEGTPEAGWAFVPAVHGRGFATEALRAMLAWSDAKLGKRTVCIIHPDHAASLRVAAKCGYRERTRTVYQDEATVLLERLG